MIEQFYGKYAWLSNFYPVKIEFEGITYPSVENAYQAAKTDDVRIKIQIAETPPATAKKIGKTLTPSHWREEGQCLRIMKELLRIKFSDPELKQRLIDTGIQELVEGNYWGDTYWGTYRGKGWNHLGHLLMEVRAEAR